MDFSSFYTWVLIVGIFVSISILIFLYRRFGIHGIAIYFGFLCAASAGGIVGDFGSRSNLSAVIGSFLIGYSVINLFKGRHKDV